jgi:radical SAM protein with 4Fe4S-binding SPASM domain
MAKITNIRKHIQDWDEKIYNDIKTSDTIKKLQDDEAFKIPGDTILAIPSNSFLRRDKTQVVFYGRVFLDSWSLRITPNHAAIIALFDGERTIDDITTLLHEYCGGSTEVNDFKLRRALHWAEVLTPNKNRVVKVTDSNRASLSIKKYDPKDFFIPKEQVELKIPLDKPISMMWMPTSVCQTDCIYCYATRRDMPQSELLSDTRVKELFDEAAEIGVVKVNVDGGDALCRKNIAELLSYAISLDLQVDISTKGYVSKDMAKKLADAGIKIMQFGFDAPTPELFDKIVRRKGHFYRTIESLHNCVDAGIAVRTNSILVQESAPYIHELISLLHTLPLRDMKIAAAFRTAYRHTDGLVLPESQKQWLREQIDILKEKYPEGKIKFECRSDYLDMTDKQKKEAFETYPRCAIGTDALIITPDGKVVMCEQSPHDPDFVVGDVKHNNIMDVWQCEKMQAFRYVTREQYKGTVCYDCEQFEECFHQKGGCLILTVKAYGTRFAPLPPCPKAPKYDVALM